LVGQRLPLRGRHPDDAVLRDEARGIRRDVEVCIVLAPRKPVERRKSLELGNLSSEPCG
jgi:hypothetical protein